MPLLVSWSLDSAGVTYRARCPSDEAAGYHRETISSRALTPATQGSGRAVSLSHKDVIPAGYGPVGSGRPGTATRIIGQYRANSQGKMATCCHFRPRSKAPAIRDSSRCATPSAPTSPNAASSAAESSKRHATCSGFQPDTSILLTWT